MCIYDSLCNSCPVRLNHYHLFCIIIIRCIVPRYLKFDLRRTGRTGSGLFDPDKDGSGFIFVLFALFLRLLSKVLFICNTVTKLSNEFFLILNTLHYLRDRGLVDIVKCLINMTQNIIQMRRFETLALFALTKKGCNFNENSDLTTI